MKKNNINLRGSNTKELERGGSTFFFGRGGGNFLFLLRGYPPPANSAIIHSRLSHSRLTLNNQRNRKKILKNTIVSLHTIIGNTPFNQKSLSYWSSDLPGTQYIKWLKNLEQTYICLVVQLFGCLFVATLGDKLCPSYLKFLSGWANYWIFWELSRIYWGLS